MKGKERREQIIKIITDSNEPVPGSALAATLNVSRQVIVQDIALLREGGTNIISTNRGYVVEQQKQVQRVFKVHHSDEESADELRLFVDCGGISSYLKKITSDYHYHTIIADNTDTLDLIQDKLKERGYLAELQDYEPDDLTHQN